jgi:LysR family transcriptional activator of nhaA
MPMGSIGKAEAFMEWLNYHHLLYFWTVAKEGSVAKASTTLRLAQPTISGQIRALEEELGEKLFARAGRGLVLTDVGRLVYKYADEIFSIGRELREAVKGRPSGRPLTLNVGIVNILPKLVAYRILEPALRLNEKVRVVCREEAQERLLGDLSVNAIDVVLTDAPLPPALNVRAYNHMLGECGVSVFASRELANQLRKDFPRSLNSAPALLPTKVTTLRRSLDLWFTESELQPDIRGEFDDTALMMVFGQAGDGVFFGHTVIEDEIMRQYDVELVGRIESIRERFYAITVERRLKHPAVVALSRAAREELFS